MATVYFDIKLSEFYTESRPLYPYDFTDVGATVKSRLEDFIRSVDSFHIGSIGDVVTFNLTDENSEVIKISAAPFEVDKDDDDATVFRVKYGYVAMFPRSILNSLRVFRSLVYCLSKVENVQKAFQSSDNVQVIGTKAYYQDVLDITYKNQYNTYAAVVGFKIKKL